MRCAQCGAISDEGQRFCYNCGARLEAQYAPPTQPAPSMPAPPPPAPIQPGQYQSHGQYQPPHATYGAPVIPNSNMAIVSLVSGILAWIVLPFIAAAVAVVTGHMARNEIRQSGGRLSGEGMAVIGMVLGYAQLALFVLGACFLLFFIVAVA
jgi:hypothetical protein